MKKRFTFLIAVLIALTLITRPIMSLGQEKTETTTTYIFTAYNWNATCGGSAANWTSGQNGAGFANNGIQVTTSASGANGTSPVSFTNVTKIVATYNTNKSAGAGTIEAKIGTNNAVSKDWAYSGSADGRTANFTVQWDYATPQTGNVNIKCNTTTNSIYLVKVAITTTSGGSGEATTTTISDEGITNTNKYVSTEAGSLSASVTHGSPATAVPGATVTWSGDNDDVATIDSSTGEVTLVGAGTVNFTATYDGDTDYNSSYDTYEMTVTNENPAITTIWSENFSTYSANDVPSEGDYDYACSTGTKVMNEQLAGGSSPELLVAKNGGTFSATIPLLTPTYGYSGDLTLKYKTNAKALNVKTTTDGITVKGEASAGVGITYNTLGEHTITFEGVTNSTENITIVFTATTSDNVRLDDILLKGEQVALTKVATPIISPTSGAVASGTEVTITCLTEGATIHYTTNGETPTSSSTSYNPSSKPKVTANQTIKAIAVKDGLDDSDVASAAYTIAEPCATPTFSHGAGVIDKGTSVSINCETDGATIYYTTNGSIPTTGSSVYSSAITVNTTQTIKAIAAKDGMSNSAVASAEYTIRDYANLPFSYDKGKNDIENTTGLTHSGLGTDYGSSPKLRFDDTGDNLVLKLGEAPVTISYDIMGNGFSGGTFKVQVSEDGSSYVDLATYTSLGSSKKTVKHICGNSSVRFIKWVYTTKSSGNVALGNIIVSKSGATITENTTLSATNTMTVGAGATLTFTGTLSCDNPAWLVVEEGGQLIIPAAKDDVQATFQRDITGYGALTDNKNNYYLIASPVVDDITLTEGSGMLTANYDLYYFTNTTPGVEWRNNKVEHFNTLVNSKGYLYANSSDKIIEFPGTVPTATTAGITLNYNSSNIKYAGFNLVGNPLSVNITSMYLNSSACGYYYLSSTGVFTAVNAANVSSNPVIVGQAFMVQASDADHCSLTLNASSVSKGEDVYNDEVIRLEVSNNKYTDVAYLCFGNSMPLTKINHINDEAPMIYIHTESDDQAVAVMNERSDVKSVNVNFEAKTMGMYTISGKAERGNFIYMHLYDRLTGIDTDLLESDYTFIGSTNDAAGRFILHFEAIDYNADNESFAYQNGSDIIVNGEGELQIFDVMGRMVSTQQINGVERINVQSQGVYIFRLNEKTQKIVVR